MTGRNLKMRCDFLQQALLVGPAQREELEHRAQVEEIIDFLEIQHIRKTPVGPPALRAAEARRARRARSRPSRSCCCSTSRWPA